MKTLLQLSLLIFFILITVAGHILFRSVSTSLSVSARFVLSDSFLTFILCVVLDLAVEEVFAIPVGVAARSDLKTFVARLYIIGFLGFVGKFHVPLILEGSSLSSSFSVLELLSSSMALMVLES